MSAFTDNLPYTPYAPMPDGAIFVFGSNLAGRHRDGAAAMAHYQYGATYGIGEGRTGQAYALPTMDYAIHPRPLGLIQISVTLLLDYARANPQLTFFVTKVGCGLAGFTEAEIAPLFAGAPDNCLLPEGWRS